MPSVEQRRKNTQRVRQWRIDNPEQYRATWRKRYDNRSSEQIAQAAVRSHKWYEANTNRARATIRRGRRGKRAFLAEVVGASCVDCGDDRPGAVEYHHSDGKVKGQAPLTHLSWPKLKEEAMVLIAICGACHGVRHHKKEVSSCPPK